MNQWMDRQDGVVRKVSMMDIRKGPGAIFQAVELGMSFIVTHNGREVAVIQSPEKSGLVLHALSDGSMTYAPEKKGGKP